MSTLEILPEVPPRRRLPPWLKRPLPAPGMFFTSQVIEDLRLETVCESAKCPNRTECWSQRTATFMILGNVCTRPCGFCSVPKGKTEPLQADEPARVAEAAVRLGLAHVVITSVTRDDLTDGGADHFYQCVHAVRARSGAAVEVLTPDFLGKAEAIDRVIEAGPDVFNHNVETVPRLYHRVRRNAAYQRSLDLLARVKDRAPQIPTKSGLMLGLGETLEEISGRVCRPPVGRLPNADHRTILATLAAAFAGGTLRAARGIRSAGRARPRAGFQTGRQRPVRPFELPRRGNGLGGPTALNWRRRTLFAVSHRACSNPMMNEPAMRSRSIVQRLYPNSRRAALGATNRSFLGFAPFFTPQNTPKNSCLSWYHEMRTSVILPDLGAGDEELRVSCWLVDLGDAVDAGDRIVEILCDGVTFDVTVEQSGTVTRIERPLDSVVRAGDVLGWIETDEEPA